MKRIILYSSPAGKHFEKILALTFPQELKNKRLAYMPSDGSDSPQEYTDLWRDYAERFDSDFLYIDNSKKDSHEETGKLLSSNILVLTGGNTFTLLDNLQKSGLDKAIFKFIQKKEFVVSAFSAGALILTPSIEVCNLPPYDDNLVGLEDLTGLSLVDFEIFPHYSDEYKSELERYRKSTDREVKPISDEDYIIVEK